MRSPKDPYRCDQVALGCHQDHAHLEIRKRLLLRVYRRLIFLKIVIPVEPVVNEILGVDFLCNLKFPLVENLLEHAPSYRLVFRRLSRHVWQNWIVVSRKCRAYRNQRHEQQQQFLPHDRSPYPFQ